MKLLSRLALFLAHLTQQFYRDACQGLITFPIEMSPVPGPMQKIAGCCFSNGVSGIGKW